MSDLRTQRLHKLFPFLHSWRLPDDKKTRYRQCVTCGQMQMITNGRQR
jgi:hypothetical protein